MSEPLWQPKSDLQARILGLCFAAAGAAGLWWQVGGTIRQARESVPEIQYSNTLIVLSALFVALGLFWIARGLAAYRVMRGAGSDPRSKRWLMIAGALVGLGTYFGMAWYLGTLGYH